MSSLQENIYEKKFEHHKQIKPWKKVDKRKKNLHNIHMRLGRVLEQFKEIAATE